MQLPAILLARILPSKAATLMIPRVTEFHQEMDSTETRRKAMIVATKTLKKFMHVKTKGQMQKRKASSFLNIQLTFALRFKHKNT